MFSRGGPEITRGRTRSGGRGRGPPNRPSPDRPARPVRSRQTGGGRGSAPLPRRTDGAVSEASSRKSLDSALDMPLGEEGALKTMYLEDVSLDFLVTEEGISAAESPGRVRRVGGRGVVLLADIYQLGEVLGRGHYGTVSKAINVKTADIVAVKQIPISALDTDRSASLLAEQDMLRDLRHPNVVKFLDFVKENESLNLVLEFVEGGSLGKLIGSFGVFPEPLVATYVDQILRGLAYLHSKGIVHRDLKADNVLITKDGICKLADFGTASLGPQGDDAVVGTPYWMAPEVIQMEGSFPSSDIWSLGCAVVEMLSGEPPYSNLGPMGALFRIVQDGAPPLPPGISALLGAFLSSCFQQDRAKRASAEDLLKHPFLKKSDEPVAPGDRRRRRMSVWDAKDAIVDYNTLRGKGKSSAASLIMAEHPTAPSDPAAAGAETVVSSQAGEFLVEQIEMYLKQAGEGSPLNSKAILASARELHKRTLHEQDRRKQNQRAKQKFKIRAERLATEKDELERELEKLKRSDIAHYHFKISMLETAFSEDMKILRAVYGSDSMISLEKLTTPSSLDGYMYIQAKGKKTWKTVWCLLRDNFIVVYPADQKKKSVKKSDSGTAPTKVIRVDESSIIRHVSEEQCGKSNAFCVFRRSLGYNFASDSPEVTDEWMEAITLPHLRMWWEKLTSDDVKPRLSSSAKKLNSKLAELGYDQAQKEKIKRML